MLSLTEYWQYCICMHEGQAPFFYKIRRWLPLINAPCLPSCLLALFMWCVYPSAPLNTRHSASYTQHYIGFIISCLSPALHGCTMHVTILSWTSSSSWRIHWITSLISVILFDDQPVSFWYAPNSEPAYVSLHIFAFQQHISPPSYLSNKRVAYWNRLQRGFNFRVLWVVVYF